MSETKEWYYWHPASQPPEHGRKVMLWFDRSWRFDGEKEPVFGHYSVRLKEWRIEGSPSSWNDTVQFWMELPPPPEQAGESSEDRPL